MTNLEIIEKAKKAHGVKGDVDTYQGWQRRGLQVQKGQKALFQTKIWKPLTAKKNDVKDVTEVDDQGNVKMIMVKAYFFGADQVAEN